MHEYEHEHDLGVNRSISLLPFAFSSYGVVVLPPVKCLKLARCVYGLTKEINYALAQTARQDVI